MISPALSRFRVYVDGNTGVVDSAFGGEFLFQPATASSEGPAAGSWRPDILKLIRTSACVPDTGETGPVECSGFSQNDQLYVELGPRGNAPDLPYHVIFEFTVIAASDPNDVIPLTPAVYISSGADNLKKSEPSTAMEPPGR